MEIVSTYSKYQEQLDRKSDIQEIAETLGAITEAARELALNEADDWFDAQTVKRNMKDLNNLGEQFKKVAVESKRLDERLTSLYEDMGHILSRYYKVGELTEDEMKSRLGIKESKDCGCGCGGSCSGNDINEGKSDSSVKKSGKKDTRNSWNKHLRPDGKRAANKKSRQQGKVEEGKEQDLIKSLNKGDEIKFYDSLESLYEKLGHAKYMKTLSLALKDYGIDMFRDSKIKTKADAEEKLYDLTKK